MKAAIYIRVSTEEQVKEGYSVSAQKQKLKSFCISQGWEVAGLYPDEGISAKDTNRPELKRMIQDIKQDKIDCVLVYRLDRLTRSVFDLYKLLEVFEKYDCKFKSATEVYDTTSAMGRMFITIVAALAQWERENMGERIAFGFAEKARQGKWPMNFAPIGYDLLETGVLTINQKEDQTVKKIFKLYQTMGMPGVAKQLNNEGIPTKEGNRWSDNTIMKVLRGHHFCGEIYWNGQVYHGNHEPIIDKDFWDQTQELMKQRNRTPSRSVSSRYIFSSKLKCPNCGKTLIGSYSTYKGKNGTVEYPHYRCQEKRHGRCKGTKYIRESKLEKAFVEYLNQQEYDHLFSEVAATSEQSLNKEETNDIEELQKQLDKIEKRKKKWQYAWTEDIMSYEDFKKRMDEAKQEEASINEKLSAYTVEESPEPIDQEEIINALSNIKNNWSALEHAEKKNLVSQIVKQIHFKHDGDKVSITHIDFL